MSETVKVVLQEDGYIAIHLGRHEIYDFDPQLNGGPEFWIQHISRKSWATPEILADIERLCVSK